MATSGLFNGTFDYALLIEEAYERCGIDPADLTQRHVSSAMRSIDLLFAHWQTQGFTQYRMVYVEDQAIALGDNTFTMPTGGIWITHMTIKVDGFETEMYPMSRQEWSALHDKDLRARPDRYFTDIAALDKGAPLVRFWSASDSAAYTFSYWYVRHHVDVNELTESLDVPYQWREALASGLAQRLCVKHAPDRYQILTTEAVEAFGAARSFDRERADVVMRVEYGRSRGR